MLWEDDERQYEGEEEEKEEEAQRRRNRRPHGVDNRVDHDYVDEYECAISLASTTPPPPPPPRVGAGFESLLLRHVVGRRIEQLRR